MVEYELGFIAGIIIVIGIIVYCTYLKISLILKHVEKFCKLERSPIKAEKNDG